MHTRWRFSPSHVFRHLLILMMATSLALTAWVKLVEPQPVGATHFRAMQLNWKKSGPRQATFTATFSARWSYPSYSSPAVGAMIPESPIVFGDSTQSADSLFRVTYVDQLNDFLIAEKIEVKDYSGDGPFTAYIDSCCRLSPSGGHVNNPDDSVRITTVVNFTVNTADLGSPESGLAPIIDCPRLESSVGTSTCTFFVTANDPSSTGYRLEWRMADISEMGSGVTAQPSGPFGNASVDPDNGLYSWDTTDATLSTCPGAMSCNYTYYSTQVIVEKWYENGTPGDPSNDVLVSHVAIDFFIRFNNNPANHAPQFTSGPSDGDTLTWQPGQASNFTFTADDIDSGDTVTPNVIGLPANAVFTPTPGNPASGTLSWANPISGTYQIVLVAQDQTGLGATPRTITIVVPTLPPTSLTVSGTGTYGGTGTLTATLTGTAAAPIVGEKVLLTLNGVQVCENSPTYTATCPTTDSSGVATLTNVPLTGLNADTPYPIGATFLGNSSYLGSTASNTLTLAKANQTINFPNPGAQTYGGPLVTLTATATSGLPITYTLSGPCQLVNGNQVQIIGAGTCIVTASQPGNGNYNAATPVIEAFSIDKADTSTTADDKTIVYGTTSLPLTAQVANIDNGASLTGGTVVLTVKDSSNVTLCTTTPAAVSGGTSVPVSATCTFATPPNAGTYIIEATYSGDANFYGSSDTATLTVQKANQTITFPDPADVTYGDGPITLTATSTSGLTVSYSVSGPCDVTGNQLQITGAGTCTVTATQPGDPNYNAATPVVQTVAIARKVLTVRVNNQTIQFGQTPACVLTSGYPQGFISGESVTNLGGTLSCTPTPTPIVNVGSFPLVLGGYTSSNYNFNYVNATVTVNKCQGTLELTMLPVGPLDYSDQGTFQAQFRNCGGSTYPSGSVQFTIDNSIIGADTFDSLGLAEISVQVMQGVGNRTVMARFTSTDTRFASANSAPGTLTLTEENATATYSGSTSFPINNVTKKGTVQLSATIKDITAVTGHADYDAYAGDVRTAKVRFVYATGNQAGQVVNAACNNLSVALVNYNDTKVGTASCSFASAAATYEIRVEVFGNYIGTSAAVTVRVGNGSGQRAFPEATASGQPVAWREEA